jgi:hypothetical protein
VTVKGVEIDGNFPTCTWGIGIDVNDHDYKLADHQGEWREGYVFKNNFIHSTARSGIYFGPNQDDEAAGDLQVRNNEIAYNYVTKTGCDGIKYKSVLEGQSSIHHNYVSNTGQSTAGSSDGCSSNGIILYEAGYTDIHSNYVESPSLNSGGQGNCILQYTQDLSSAKVARLPTSIYNNTVHNCKGAGIAIGRKDSSVSMPVATISYNTVVAPVGGAGITVNSSVTSCTVRDNLVAGESISAGQCVLTNNRVGTVESQQFHDPNRRDFRLTASSPALNAGSTQCPALDQVRTLRPLGGACDQGALESLGADGAATPRPPEPLVVN